MTQELRTIRLFGHLGKRFGKVHHYAISSPAEAVRAMSCTIPGFRDYVGIEHARSGFRVLVGGEAVGAEQLGEISGGQEIRIVPVVRGAKSSLGQIIMGAVLIAAVYFTGGAAGFFGSFAPALYGMGASMILGGVAGILASPPDPLSYGAGEDNRPSNYLFNGSNQATPSGGPVPVLYGRLEIPLTLISGSITPERSSYGNSQLGMLGDGNGTWSGDGNTVPRAASIRGEATTTTVETAKMMFALSEGPCAGLADGLKSIKFDGTPVEAPDGSHNFKGVSFALVNGTSTQQAIPGFPATETEHSAGGEIKTSQPQYITVNDLGTSLVRVKIAFQALQKIDTTSGKPVGTSVQIAIDVQASGGSYVAQTLTNNGIIADLSSGPTSRAFSVPLAGTGPWTLRVRRITADSTDTYLQNKTFLGSYTEVKDGKLRNPWTAKLAVALNAKEFASIPKITVDYLGRSTVKVPVNYDPATRVYTGVWNGTFKEAWTDNPVWCFYDMATHGRYGAGRYLAAEGLDIWTLYQIAQYCDGLVSDGMGGTEPRYRFNAYFTKDEEAFKVLAHMVSVARAQLYYGGSIDRPATALTAIQDVESTPTALFSPSNVIGGRFSYSGTPRKTRYTEVTVWWNDPAQAYKLVPVLVVADPAYVARYGVQSYETVAFGATSKGQAIREGRRILLTNLLEQEIISFSSGMEGIVAYPGGLVQVQDPGRDQKRQGGRLKDGCTTTSLILDGSVTLAPATAYTAWVTMPDGTVLSRAISTGAGTVSTVTVAALPSAPAAEAQWQITPTATTPTRWRIIGVKEVRGDEAISYEITAIANAPEKYPLIDQCGTITVVDPETPSTFAPVTGLSASSKTSWSVGKATINLSAQWTMPTGATGAVAWASVENGPWQELYVSGSSATGEVSGIGSCRVRVVAQYRNGSSAPTEATITALGIPTTTPTSLTITKTETRPPLPSGPTPTSHRVVSDEVGTVIHPPIDDGDPTILCPTFLTFDWAHADANIFALKGFRLVVFTGTDPNDTSKYLRAPVEMGLLVRNTVVVLSLESSQSVNAAIQAIYLDGNESSWRLISGAVAADPDTVAIPTRAVINTMDGRIDGAIASAAAAVAAAATAQAAADGKIDSYYQTAAPATASEGDLWFDTDDGNKLYTRRSGAWVATQDSGIGAAIAAAATAQGTADGKARIYYQAAAPTGLGASDQGDLWVDTDDNLKVWAWTGSAWVVAQDWFTANAAAAAAATAAAYADALARSSHNLVKNGNSSNHSATGLEATGLSQSGVSNSAIPSAPYQASGYWRAFSWAAGFTGYFTLAQWDVVPGDQYVASCLAGFGSYSEAGTTLRIIWDSDTTSFIGSASSSNLSGYYAGAGTTLNVSGTAPSGAVMARLVIYVQSAPHANAVYANYFSARKKLGIGELEADIIRSSDYAEDGNGDPTAGFSAGIGQVAPIKCGPLGLQVGRAKLREENLVVNRISNGIFYSSISPWVASGSPTPIYTTTSRVALTGGAQVIHSATIVQNSTVSFNGTGSLSQVIRAPDPINNRPAVLKVWYRATRADTGGNTSDSRSYTGTISAYLTNLTTGAAESLAGSAACTVDGTWRQATIAVTSSLPTAGDYLLRMALNITGTNTNSGSDFTPGQIQLTLVVDEIDLSI